MYSRKQSIPLNSFTATSFEFALLYSLPKHLDAIAKIAFITVIITSLDFLSAVEYMIHFKYKISSLGFKLSTAGIILIYYLEF